MTASTTLASLIVVTAVGVGQGKKKGQATVTGNFIGTIAQPGVSAMTSASCVAVLQVTGTASGNVNVTFCVTNVTKSGLKYASSANVVTCDSN